jgi:beta-glucosidase
VTLYHWDLPQVLEDEGGWRNRDCVDWFGEYCEVVVNALGDRVKNWIIINEPQVIAYIGAALGSHAPGAKGQDGYLSTVHNLNRAVGRTYNRLKALNQELNIGSTYCLSGAIAEDTNPENIAAAEVMDSIWVGNHLDPLFFGRYPNNFATQFDAVMQPGDQSDMKASIDFVGIQHYCPTYTVADPAAMFGVRFGESPEELRRTTVPEWTVEPQGLTEILMRLKYRYHNPTMIITESGTPVADRLTDGKIVDKDRIAYFNGYLNAALRAIQLGANLRGFFVWSLMDNLEFTAGFTQRFGLVYIDVENDWKRIPKASYTWFRDVVKYNSLPAKENL